MQSKPGHVPGFLCLAMKLILMLNGHLRLIVDIWFRDHFVE